MAKTTKTKKDMTCEHKRCCTNWKSGCGGCAYFLGFLGAAVYYVQTTTGFWGTILGLLKALVWPAMLVYKLFML